MIDVSEVLSDPDLVEEIQILRRTCTLTAGVPSYAEVPDTIYGSIQPAEGEILTILPEGTLLGDAIMIYTNADLRADGPGTVSDVVLDGGRRYAVHAIPESFRRYGYVGAVGVAEAMSGVHDAE